MNAPNGIDYEIWNCRAENQQIGWTMKKSQEMQQIRTSKMTHRFRDVKFLWQFLQLKLVNWVSANCVDGTQMCFIKSFAFMINVSHVVQMKLKIVLKKSNRKRVQKIIRFDISVLSLNENHLRNWE